MPSFLTMLVGVAAAGVTITGFGVYLFQAIRGQVRPHAISWFLWGIVPLIVALIQITENAGPAVITPLLTGLMAIIIGCYALKKGSRKFSSLDITFALLSVLSLVAWLLARSPLLAVVLLTLTDILAFGPTIRKAWQEPDTEKWFMYGACVMRNVLALSIMDNRCLTNVLYPAVWIIADLSFCAMLTMRQRSYQQEYDLE